MLLRDIFHILAVPSCNTVLEIFFVELQGKNAALRLNTERRKFRVFLEKRAKVSVAEKRVRMK